jgi:hypothetical protein
VVVDAAITLVAPVVVQPLRRSQLRHGYHWEQRNAMEGLMPVQRLVCLCSLLRYAGARPRPGQQQLVAAW